MIKKATAAVGIILLPATLLTGCSSKLTAADTCSYIIDSAHQSGLDQRLIGLNAALTSEDYGSAAAPLADYGQLLLDAADQSEDEELAESLNTVASWSKSTSVVLGDGTLNSSSKVEKTMTLAADQNLQKQAKHLYSVCPGLDYLG